MTCFCSAKFEPVFCDGDTLGTLYRTEANHHVTPDQIAGAVGKDTAQTAVTDAAGGLISVEHPLDLLGVGRLGQRQHQQDTCLLRVKRI
jgi:hypothetical protein